jgi:hypothetical protein
MRTVHETEALRPSDPVPKHHSSNPINNRQRLKLVLNSDGTKKDKGSTPGSPASHSHPPNSAATLPPGAAPASEADYAHNNIVHLQDLTTGHALVQFPPDIEFTEQELRLPAPELFQLLRKQLAWATQEGEELRRRQEQGMPGDMEGWPAVENDVVPSKSLPISAKDGKLPWWRRQQESEEVTPRPPPADIRHEDQVPVA